MHNQRPDNQVDGQQGELAEHASVREQLEWSHGRIRQLLDESRLSREQSAGLRQKVAALSSERRSLAELLIKAERLVQAMEAGITEMRRSTSMQLGYLLTHSVRSVGGLIRLPGSLYRLAIASRGQAGRPADTSAPVPVPLPQQWFPTSLRRDLQSFYKAIDPASDSKKHVQSASQRLPEFRFHALPDHLGSLRVAAIMDEFTFSAYRDCCQLLQVTPDGWRSELEEFSPHLFFIESAWEGKNASWQRKVSGCSEELRAIVEFLRARGVPVVFWSKEDPVHFKAFLPTARLADIVFTTDIDCIPHYRAELGHNRVHLLPFATQPSEHNPIERYERKPMFCFAGSYYVRYPVRQKDFASLIEAAEALGGVDIYDRNFGKEHPNFVFPEVYRPKILGGLAFDQIDLAYKGYDFGININTVKHSQSMFARRIFDLLASNTTTISNYSRGVRLMFGDLVICSDNADRLVEATAPLVTDDVYRRKHRLAGLRKVLHEHTYQHRLAYLAEKTFGRIIARETPLVSVLARPSTRAELERIVSAFRRQAWSFKELVLCVEPGLELGGLWAPDIRVLSRHQAESRQLASLLGENGCVAAFHPDDYYGKTYLTDLALGLAFSGGAPVGKACYHLLAEGDAALQSPGLQYRQGVKIRKRRALVPSKTLEASTVSAWLDRLDESFVSELAVSLDEFNYCEGGAQAHSMAPVDDIEIRNQGLAIDRLLEIADTETKFPSGNGRDESAGLVGMGGLALHAALEPSKNRAVSFRLQGDELTFESSLGDGKHAYVYLADRKLPQDMLLSDIGRLQLVCDRPESIDLVLVYFDTNAEKISHSILKSGINVTVSVPPATVAVQIGFRLRGSGTCLVRRLVFEHVPLAVEAMVPRARYLVLVKNYPSYDDLYKHAFIHRRVVEYRKQGVDVDVFRIGNGALNYNEFDGVDVVSGQADHLRAAMRTGRYDAVLVHFLDERMWEVLQEFIERTRVFVWAHGAEIQSAGRREFDHVDEESRRRAVILGDRRMAFWRRLFTERHPNMHYVFVSRWFAQDVFDDVGMELPSDAYTVIHNFIDADLFAFNEKGPEQRNRVLSIRPYESRKYANDLAVASVLALRDKPFFNELEFRFIGDGRLFEETLEPIAGLPNVRIERRFLTQGEIAELHGEYGVFLNPTRMDAQGVSRDEAMASGLVPITSRCTAIPEFVDESCGFLAGPEDVVELAEAIERLHLEPHLFETMSRAAARRVRDSSSSSHTIAREIELFARTNIEEAAVPEPVR